MVITNPDNPLLGVVTDMGI